MNVVRLRLDDININEMILRCLSIYVVVYHGFWLLLVAAAVGVLW